MNIEEQCPACLTDLRGAAIPETDPVKYYSHLIMVEIPTIYDGGLFYECPYCSSRFHRWREGTDLWRRAEPYVKRLPIHPRKPRYTVTLNSGQILTGVHDPSDCEGRNCAIHNPSNHPLRDNRLEWFNSRLVRFCQHGLAHPDVDDLRWRQDNGLRVPRRHRCCSSRCCGISASLDTSTQSKAADD